VAACEHLRAARLALEGCAWARHWRVRLATLEAAGELDLEALRGLINGLIEYGPGGDRGRSAAVEHLTRAWKDAACAAPGGVAR